jgi:hypothetical protein
MEKLLLIKNERPFDSKRGEQCLNLLRQHMKVSHLRQFTVLLKQLLTHKAINSNNKSNTISQQQMCQLLTELGRLRTGNRL